MRPSAQTAITIFFPIYLFLVLFAGVSLTGFWTDVIFTFILAVLSVIAVLNVSSSNPWRAASTIITNVVCLLVVLMITAAHVMNPFAWNTFKQRSFHFVEAEGRMFNAYFKPVGAYGGGYGQFTITETPKYFPVVEWAVYNDRTVDYDFNDNTFEGRPVNTREVVYNIILREIIKQQ